MTKINSTELLEVLAATPPDQNIMLVGKHGIGKSEILSDYFSAKGCRVVPLFLGQMSDPGDIIGLPNKNEKTGTTEFLPPSWFPVDGKPVVLFLDELNRARPEVLQTIMDLALNRKLAGRSLPEGSRIISAVNDGEEYQLTDLDPALVSRFNVYEFVPLAKEWLLWAERNGIDSRIIDFISHNVELLDGDSKKTKRLQTGEGTGLEKAPDRRGWVRVSKIIFGKQNLTAIDKKIVAGILGAEATSKFFEEIGKSKIPSPKDILLGDFSKIKNELAKYNTPEIAALNDEIFRFVEAKHYPKKQAASVAENLQKYFDFLVASKTREGAAHFANMFSNTLYPEALVFVMENCGALYESVMEFVKSL